MSVAPSRRQASAEGTCGGTGLFLSARKGASQRNEFYLIVRVAKKGVFTAQE